MRSRTTADIQKYFLGSILNGGGGGPATTFPQNWLQVVNEYQSWALKTRLKIPLIYGIDAVHGHNNMDGAVIFPHNIGLGATHDPALVEQAGTRHGLGGCRHGHSLGVCAVHRRGARRTLGPHLRKFRRFYRTGVRTWRGGRARFSGQRLSSPTSVLACAKHFIGDGGTQNGVDQGDDGLRRGDVAKTVSAALPVGHQGRRRFHHGFLQQLEWQKNARQQISC